MSQITIPGLPNNPTPPSTVLFEISNAGVSENVTLAAIIIGLQNISEKNQANGYPGLDGSSLIAQGQIPDLPQSRIIDLESDLALKEDAVNKGAVSGYAGIDANKELLLGNFPAGNALEVLRRNIANNALEFAVVAGTPQTPIEQDIDYANFGDFNKRESIFNEQSEPATPAAGKIVFWAEGVLGTDTLRFKGGDGVVQTILEDTVLPIRNKTGGTLFKGEAVYIDGQNGGRITVDRAIATSLNTAPAAGVMENDVLNNGDGFVLISGTLGGLNTQTFAVGDFLFLSDTAPGEFQNTEPLHPSLDQIMGVVLVKSPSAGAIGIITGQITGAEQGTQRNIFKIGDGLVGPKQIQMVNDFTQTLNFNPTANVTVSMPDAAGVFVLDTFAQTLTSKSIAFGGNTISTTFAELNAAVTDATLVDLDDAQILTSKSLDALTNTITNIGSPEVIPDIISGQTLKAVPVAADEILITDSAAAGVLKRTTLTALLAMAVQTPIAQNVDYASFNITNLGLLNTHTIPGGTDTFAMLAAVQTLTNKSIDLTNNALTTTFTQLNAAVSDATLVDLVTAQSLTNKSIDAALNTLTGVSGITGLGTQVQSLNMGDNDIIFGIGGGGQIGTTTAQKIAFYGNTPIVQPIDGATLTNNVTVGGTTDQIDDFTDLTTYATDAATIRNDIYQLARKVKIITDNLRALGLAS